MAIIRCMRYVFWPFTDDPTHSFVVQLTCEDVPYRAENREAAGEASPPARRTHSYWISTIHAGARSPTGRGTKGFIALDIDHKQVVFLKDYWCADVEGIHPELDTYARLRGSVFLIPLFFQLRQDGPRRPRHLAHQFFSI